MAKCGEIAALLCGILEDSGRVLFLIRRDGQGQEMLEMPYAAVKEGENEVAALATAFREQAGIDVQVHGVIMQGRYNAGSRKRRRWVPALGFKVTAKSARVNAGEGFMGYRWVALDEIGNFRLGRSAGWLKGKGKR